MKLSTLLILACVGTIAYAILTDNPGGATSPQTPAASWSFAVKSTPAPSSSPADPAPPGFFTSALAYFKRGLSATTPAADHRTSRQRAELRIARGILVDQPAGGLVMNCSGWVVRSISGGVYAGDGRGMNAIYGNLVETHEQFDYGRLMQMKDGVAQQSVYDRDMWTIDSYLSGVVFVKGYPQGRVSRGKGFKVVVAPDGEQTAGQSNPGVHGKLYPGGLTGKTAFERTRKPASTAKKGPPGKRDHGKKMAPSLVSKRRGVILATSYFRTT